MHRWVQWLAQKSPLWLKSYIIIPRCFHRMPISRMSSKRTLIDNKAYLFEQLSIVFSSVKVRSTICKVTPRALCVIWRRPQTRNLFLEACSRRSFTLRYPPPKCLPEQPRYCLKSNQPKKENIVLSGMVSFFLQLAFSKFWLGDSHLSMPQR